MDSNREEAQKKLICFCNRVPKSTVEELAASGTAFSLDDVYDACGAGVGPCGGSCRDAILKIIRKTTAAVEPEENAEIPPISMEMVHAISLFNRRYYWETHEVLEDVWREETGKQKIFTQGLIQAAAALYHVLNANPTGVVKLGQAALEKLSSVDLSLYGVDCSKLIKSLQYYQQEGREILAKEKSGFDYARLPTLSHGKHMSTSGQNLGE